VLHASDSSLLPVQSTPPNMSIDWTMRDRARVPLAQDLEQLDHSDHWAHTQSWATSAAANEVADRVQQPLEHAHRPEYIPLNAPVHFSHVSENIPPPPSPPPSYCPPM
jgi:hypothetical protein